MAGKRNNKKAKTNVQALRDLHQISWGPSTKKTKIEAGVNSQFNKARNTALSDFSNDNTAKDSVQFETEANTSKDIKKSLLLVSLVLALEIVLYLLWKKYW